MFFIFPDMFSREKTLSFLAHGLLPVPKVKSSSHHRTTNTTTLVKQKYTALVMAIVLEVGVSHDLCLLQGAPIPNQKQDVSGEIASSRPGGHPAFTYFLIAQG